LPLHDKLSDIKANVIHGDFNPCGGAERLSLVTMQALLEMGIDFDLTTLKSPDILQMVMQLRIIIHLFQKIMPLLIATFQVQNII
jgi:hypothetical protein